MEESALQPELSRTRKKQHSHELQKLGEHLASINRGLLKSLDLPEELLEALGQTSSISSHGARRRQLQYIGRLMLHLDQDQLAAVREVLEDQGAISRKNPSVLNPGQP